MYRGVYVCSWLTGKEKWANQGAVRGVGCTFMKYRHTTMWVRVSGETRTVRLKDPMKQPPWHRREKRK
jgi:hypothetical protein